MVNLLEIISWGTLAGDALLLAIFFALLALLQRGQEDAPPEPETRPKPEARPESEAARVERENRDAWRILQAYDADAAYGVRNAGAETGDGG